MNICHLGADNFYVVASYLDAFSLVSWQLSCKGAFSSTQHDELWAHLLPQFAGFAKKLNLQLAKLKTLRYLTLVDPYRRSNDKKMQLSEITTIGTRRWERLGRISHLEPRLLARSTFSTECGLNFIFGGDNGKNSENGSNFLNDVWAIDCDEESCQLKFYEVQLSPQSLKPRAVSASALACLNGDLYLFGGMATVEGFSISFTNQLWVLRNAAKFCPPDSTSVSNLNAQAADPIFWENLAQESTRSRYTHEELEPISVDSLPAFWPSGRWGHTMLSTGNELILFGGSSPIQSYEDLWVYTPNRGSIAGGWHQLITSNTIGARGGHSAAIVGNYMYVHGGNDVSASFYDLWRISLAGIRASIVHQETVTSNVSPPALAWELVSEDVVSSGGPKACIGLCMTPIGNNLIFYGGRDKHKRKFGTGVYLYNCDSSIWTLFDLTSGSSRERDFGASRTGHCALPISTGIAYVGGMLQNNTVADEVLHLNIFGSKNSTSARMPATSAIAQEGACDDDCSSDEETGGYSLLNKAISALSAALSVYGPEDYSAGNDSSSASDIRLSYRRSLRIQEFPLLS